MVVPLKSALTILAVAVACSGAPVFAQNISAAGSDQPMEQKNPSAASAGDAAHPSPGYITGTIVDQSGAVVAGAQVTLTGGGQSQQAVSGSDGQFFFPNVAPGEFRLAITSAGFATQAFSGTLHPGEIETLPQIAMNVADARVEVQVGLTQVEVAEEEVKFEEKQRVLGVIPNFYVSYVPDAAPLDAKQKFKLAFRSMIDPFTFVVVAGTAGVEQAQNHFAGYGQGAQGYAKRFAASFGDATTGTLIGAAIFPVLLRQDPRYFYKGTGSVPSRAAYAIANAFICKGDNGRWQPNYSNVLGSLAAGGISNLYYPEQDRNGAGLTFENGAIGIGATAISNLFQEFIVKKLTPRLNRQPGGH
ncbi:MAG: carboxypeptidase-like regulatory domain-containing protein [Terriglobales bacterium]